MPALLTPYDLPPPETRPQREPSLALKFRVWRKQLELDRELAAGADPDASEDLSLRAAQLADPRRRELEAKGIEKLVGIVDRRRAATPLAPFRPLQVRANRARLLDLADRLRDGEPAEVRGLARTTLVLEDGGGPLATGDDPRALARAVRAARAALDG